MKRFLFAALLGVTVLATAGPVLAEGETPTRPEGLTEGVVVMVPMPPPDSYWP